MQFRNFYNNATKYLPKLQLRNDPTSINVYVLESVSYKENLKTISQDADSILYKLSCVPSFEGKAGQSAFVTIKEKKFIVFLTNKELSTKQTAEQQEVGASICNVLNSYKIASANLIVDQTISHSILVNILYGVLLRNYRFNDFFSKKIEGKEPYLKEINVENFDNETTQEIINLVKNIMLARHLVNYPSTDLNPVSYSSLIADGFEDDVKVRIVGKDEMEKLGMNMLLAVGRAGKNESKMVIMEYKGNSYKSDFDLALVGKGVCFDSGGLSIKPGNGMEDMKIDMGGSAVAFTSIRTIAKAKLRINVVALVGLVENLVDNNAYRPGDILKSMSGQTVEVLNTDAEGRLVLGDVLYYTQKNYKPKYMINYATLTGAVTVALADIFAGYMANDDEIAKKLEEASLQSGDRIWRLPLHEQYDKMIDSTVADMKNIGSGRGAGTITAGQFLARFVNCEEGMKTKWAHLDIAGVAYDGKGGSDPRVSKGATGHSIALTYKLAKALS